MNKKSLIILFLVFLLPLISAFLYFQYIQNSPSFSTTNYGELVTPMVKINNQKATGYWTYVVVAKQCDESCRKRIKTAETTRVLSNDEMRRVKTLFISEYPLKPSDLPKNISPKMLSQLSHTFTAQQWQDLTQQFKLNNTELLNSILLLDPLGNFMMKYPAKKQDAKFMLRDLKRLLKYSRIG